MLSRVLGFLSRATALLRLAPPPLEARRAGLSLATHVGAARPALPLRCGAAGPLLLTARAAVFRRSATSAAAMPLAGSRSAAAGGTRAFSLFHSAPGPKPAAKRGATAALAAATKERLLACLAEHLPFLKFIARVSSPAASVKARSDREPFSRHPAALQRPPNGTWWWGGAFARVPSSRGARAGFSRRGRMPALHFGPACARTSASLFSSLGTLSGWLPANVLFHAASRSLCRQNGLAFTFADCAGSAGVTRLPPFGAADGICGRAKPATPPPARRSPAESLPNRDVTEARSLLDLLVPASAEAHSATVYLSFLLYGSAAWDSAVLSTSSAFLERGRSGNAVDGEDRLFSSTVQNFAAAVELQNLHLTSIVTILERLAATAAAAHLAVERQGCELRVLFPRGVPVHNVRRALIAAGIDPDSPHFFIESSVVAEGQDRDEDPDYPAQRARRPSLGLRDDPGSYRRGVEEFLSSVEKFGGGSSLATFYSSAWTTYDNALKSLIAARTVAC